MASNTRSERVSLIVAGVVSLYLGSLVVAAIPQSQGDDMTRGLWDTAFLQKRPVGRASSGRRKQQVRYRAVGGAAATPAAPTDAVVGVTIWRLRPSTAADDEEVRQLVYEQGEWTPERISADTPLL